MNKTIFSNTKSIRISSQLNSYMKDNFGYEVSGDLATLREAKLALEAQKLELRVDHQDRAYVENMLMLETIKALLKAHVAEGELPPGLKAYQDKKKGKAPAKKKAKGDGKMPMDAGKDGKMGTKDDKPAFLKKDESVSEANEGKTPKFDTAKKYSNTYEAPKEYKMKKEKLEEGLMAQLNALLEGDAQNAEITMAARGIVDELQDMIEKLGKIQNDQLGPLSDEMAYSHGPDQAQSFKDATDDAIAGLLGTARSAKDAVNNAVLVLSGEAPQNDDSMSMNDDELGGDLTTDFEDDIAADANPVSGDDSAAGPNDEPLGRAKRTS